MQPDEVERLLKELVESEPWETVGQGWPYFHMKALAVRQIELQKKMEELEGKLGNMGMY